MLSQKQLGYSLLAIALMGAFTISGCSKGTVADNNVSGVREFTTTSGVDCIWRKVGYGGGLSCNWEKYNKENRVSSPLAQ